MPMLRQLSAVVVAALVSVSAAAWAQQATPAASAGPGTVVCQSVKSCVLGIGSPAKIKYTIEASALPDADKDRLVKKCTAAAKVPCIATVTGAEMGDPLKVKAAKITWYN